VRDDPLAARSELLFRAFGVYLHWYFRRRFHAVRLSRSGMPHRPAGRPLIVYSNHPSWWDPALFMLLGRTVLRGLRGYGPMEEAALRRYGVLRRLGVFGIDLENRRGAARFLSVGRRVLSDPAASLWITGEGAFTDVRRRPVLRPGISHLVRLVPEAVVLPLAIEYTFWNESRPEALLRFGQPIDAAPVRSVAAWTGVLEAALADTMQGLGEESMTRNPGLFVPVLRGGAGVGGVYDWWRRGRALLAGRRFDPSHEGEKR